MIRILYIVSTLRKAGPTNQLLGIIKNLPKDIYSVQVLTLSPEIQGSSEKEEFLKLGIVVRTLGLGHVQGIIEGKTAVQKMISKFNPDIIHSSGIRSDVIISRLHCKAVWCATIRNYCREDYISRYGSLIGRIFVEMHLKSIRRMTYPICCSNSLKSLYEQELKNKKVYVIQNGTDIGRFFYDEKKRTSLREKFGISENTVVFISVGSLNSRKDPMTIISAFQKVKDSNVKLYILGDGPMKELCEAKRNRNIFFAGRVSQVEQYLLMADVFISASLSEGLPNSVLEAGASGLAMILSDIPQHREIWNEELDCIQFFHTGDVEALAEKIRKMEELERSSKTRKMISESIKTRFSSERTSQSYQQFYEYMLNNNK